MRRGNFPPRNVRPHERAGHVDVKKQRTTLMGVGNPQSIRSTKPPKTAKSSTAKTLQGIGALVAEEAKAIASASPASLRPRTPVITSTALSVPPSAASNSKNSGQPVILDYTDGSRQVGPVIDLDLIQPAAAGAQAVDIHAKTAVDPHATTIQAPSQASDSVAKIEARRALASLSSSPALPESSGGMLGPDAPVVRKPAGTMAGLPSYLLDNGLQATEEPTKTSSPLAPVVVPFQPTPTPPSAENPPAVQIPTYLRNPSPATQGVVTTEVKTASTSAPKAAPAPSKTPDPKPRNRIAKFLVIAAAGAAALFGASAARNSNSSHQGEDSPHESPSASAAPSAAPSATATAKASESPAPNAPTTPPQYSFKKTNTAFTGLVEDFKTKGMAVLAKALETAASQIPTIAKLEGEKLYEAYITEGKKNGRDGGYFAKREASLQYARATVKNNPNLTLEKYFQEKSPEDYLLYKAITQSGMAEKSEKKVVYSAPAALEQELLDRFKNASYLKPLLGTTVTAMKAVKVSDEHEYRKEFFDTLERFAREELAKENARAKAGKKPVSNGTLSLISQLRSGASDSLNTFLASVRPPEEDIYSDTPVKKGNEAPKPATAPSSTPASTPAPKPTGLFFIPAEHGPSNVVQPGTFVTAPASTFASTLEFKAPQTAPAVNQQVPSQSNRIDRTWTEMEAQAQASQAKIDAAKSMQAVRDANEARRQALRAKEAERVAADELYKQQERARLASIAALEADVLGKKAATEADEELEELTEADFLEVVDNATGKVLVSNGVEVNEEIPVTWEV